MYCWQPANDTATKTKNQQTRQFRPCKFLTRVLVVCVLRDRRSKSAMVETTKDVPLRQSGCLSPSPQFLYAALILLCHTYPPSSVFRDLLPVRSTSVCLAIVRVIARSEE